MLMSSTIGSGRVSVALRSASAPSTAVATSNPDSRSPRSSDANTSGSSSTTSTRGEAAPLSMPAILPEDLPPMCQVPKRRGITVAAVLSPPCHGQLNVHAIAKQRASAGASTCESMLRVYPRLLVVPDDGSHDLRDLSMSG